jgi:hypothetical protein
MTDDQILQLSTEVQVISSSVDALVNLISEIDDVSMKMVLHVLGTQVELAVSYLDAVVTMQTEETIDD